MVPLVRPMQLVTWAARSLCAVPSLTVERIRLALYPSPFMGVTGSRCRPLVGQRKAGASVDLLPGLPGAAGRSLALAVLPAGASLLVWLSGWFSRKV